VEYELTERGEELGERLQPLLEWARDDQLRQ
jgi:DNA-binding HxlR family transcriptional regulator